MDEKIANSIAIHQATVNELEEVKHRVAKHIDDDVKFYVKTRQIFRNYEPYITRCKDKIDLSPRTMTIILDEAIRKEKERIDKLIDMEIEKRISKDG